MIVPPRLRIIFNFRHSAQNSFSDIFIYSEIYFKYFQRIFVFSVRGLRAIVSTSGSHLHFRCLYRNFFEADEALGLNWIWTLRSLSLLRPLRLLRPLKIWSFRPVSLLTFEAEEAVEFFEAIHAFLKRLLRPLKVMGSLSLFRTLRPFRLMRPP